MNGEYAMLARKSLVRLLELLALCGIAMHAGDARADAAAATAAADTESLETITVTARKRDESLATVPVSITVFTGETLENYNIQSFTDYATKTPNVSFSYGGGPTGISDARTVAIRGITGQNLFGTAGATGFYIDDTPVPGSVDPRVLDIDNIEVLKGPQGTLFGESSLGGNVRLITKKPNLQKDEFSFTAQAGLTSGGGSADGGLSVIGNLAIVPDKLALRAVLFFNHDAGYLTRTFPDPASPAVADPNLAAPRTSVGNQGAVGTYGGSVAALLKVTENFDATLRVMFQNTSDHGFPATFAPLPSFTPQYTLNRAYDVQPHASDVWALPSLDLKYTGEGWSFISSTSFFYRHTQDVEDSTYGTQQVLTNYYQVGGLPNQPISGTESTSTISSPKSCACPSIRGTTSAARWARSTPRPIPSSTSHRTTRTAWWRPRSTTPSSGLGRTMRSGHRPTRRCRRTNRCSASSTTNSSTVTR